MDARLLLSACGALPRICGKLLLLLLLRDDSPAPRAPTHTQQRHKVYRLLMAGLRVRACVCRSFMNETGLSMIETGAALTDDTAHDGGVAEVVSTVVVVAVLAVSHAHP